MDELKCPSCQHLVGEPLDPKAQLQKKIEITEKYLMICAKCFEFMQGTKDGKLVILDSKSRAFVLLHKPDTMRYLWALWQAQGPMQSARS